MKIFDLGGKMNAIQSVIIERVLYVAVTKLFLELHLKIKQ